MNTSITVRTLQLTLAMGALMGTAQLAWSEDVGTVAAVEGSAEVGRGGTWASAASGTVIGVGDQLRTGRPGRMRIVFRDDSVLVLGDSTTVVVDEQIFNPSASSSVFSLVQGKLRSIVSHYYGAAGAQFEVNTPTAVAGVRGTEFVISYDPATGATEVVGLRGVVTVNGTVDPTAPGLLVTANQVTDIGNGELPTSPRAADPEQMRQLLRDIEFFGGSQEMSITNSSQVIAGALVPQPAQAPSAVGRGAALVGVPEGTGLGIDASSALGNSPAAVISRGGSGSIVVDPGQPK